MKNYSQRIENLRKQIEDIKTKREVLKVQEERLTLKLNYLEQLSEFNSKGVKNE